MERSYTNFVLISIIIEHLHLDPLSFLKKIFKRKKEPYTKKTVRWVDIDTSLGKLPQGKACITSVYTTQSLHLSFHDGEQGSQGWLREGLLGTTQAAKAQSPPAPLCTPTCATGNSSGWATTRSCGRQPQMKPRRLHGGRGKQVALGTGLPQHCSRGGTTWQCSSTRPCSQALLQPLCFLRLFFLSKQSVLHMHHIKKASMF